jgi:hypothetical protein
MRESWPGGRPFWVNPARVNGAIGDLDGDVLVYKQFQALRRSELSQFDLDERTHSNLPSKANGPE